MNELIDSFSNRLNKAIVLRNLKPAELAEKTGIDKSKISSYMSGRYKAKQDGVYLLAKALNVSEAWLMGLDVPMERNISNSSNKRIIPVVGKVSAGFDINAIVDPLGWEELDDTFPGGNEYFGLVVKGDSMEPRIYAGDVVIVKIQPNIENGEYAIVRINGDDATIKRISKDENGITLIPLNNNYLPRFYSNKDIQSIPVEIIGKVIELRARM